MSEIPRVAVFASGEGSLLQFLFQQQKAFGFQLSLLVSTKINSGAAAFAQTHRIPVELYRESRALSLLNHLQEMKIDVIFLLGFLRQVPPDIIRSYQGRILNTHPSLLPKYGGKGMYGLNVHRAVLAAGEKFSGCTIHYVTEKYDEGPILSQKTIVIRPEETPESLQENIKNLEKKNFSETLPKFFSQLKPELKCHS